MGKGFRDLPALLAVGWGKVYAEGKEQSLESWERLGCEKIGSTFSLSVTGLHLEEDLLEKKFLRLCHGVLGTGVMRLRLRK